MVGQRGRAHARGGAKFLVERPVWQLALAVWIAHGVLDGVVTVGAVAVLQDTTIESNALLRPFLVEAHIGLASTGSYLPFLRPLALKLGVAGVAALGVVALSRCCSRRATAAFATGVAASGLLVVVNNLVGLSLAGWSV